MSVRLHWDSLADLRELQADLSKAGPLVGFRASKAIGTGARMIERGMREDARGHMGNYFGIPGTEYPTPLEEHVSWEYLTPLYAEIGIEYEGAGKVAHIIVHGSANNAPVYDHTAPLRRSTPLIERLLAGEAEKSVLGDS
jgi:hypothetical protein